MLTPPTDSLYKFLAIAGLVMVMWGAAFPWNKAYETRLEGAQLRAEITAVGERAKQLQGQYYELTKELQRLETSTTDDAKKHTLRVEKRDLFIKLLDAQHPIDFGLEKIEVIEEANKTYERIGWVSVSLGIILTLAGFFGWYYKIQQYLDRDMKKEPEGK
jgi:hypothetical protein